jgi:predicted ATPase
MFIEGAYNVVNHAAQFRGTMTNQSDAERLQITRIHAENFRSIQRLELELSPLTVLVGPNASGKSNIVDVLRFFTDNLKTNLDAALAARNSFSAIRRSSSTNTGRPFDVEFGVTARGKGFEVEYSFAIASRQGGQFAVKHEYGRYVRLVKASVPIEFEIRNGNLVKPDYLFPQREVQPALFEIETSRFDPAGLAFPVVRRILRPRSLAHGSQRSDPRHGAYLAFNDLYFHLRQMAFYHMFPNVLREPQKLGALYPLSEHGENLASVLREMRKDIAHFDELRLALGKVVPGASDLRVKSVGGYLVVQMKHAS